MSPKAKPKARRVSLSREIILDAAFRVVDSEDMNEITMSRLGRELDADPSAVYRHFRNKDELHLAMADVMLEEATDAYVVGDDPIENLRRMGWTLRRSYLRRPGLARAVGSRFTGGAAEAAAIRHMMHNMELLGFGTEEAVARTRALAEMTLGHIVLTADVLALPRKAQAFELQMASPYYTRPVEPAPKLTPAEQRAAQLADGDAVYGTMLESMLTGLLVDSEKGRAAAGGAGGGSAS